MLEAGWSPALNSRVIVPLDQIPDFAGSFKACTPPARLERVRNAASSLEHELSPSAGLVRAPSTQGVALRARIILAAAQGRSNQEIAATFGTAANTVGRWRQRFLMFGVDGLTNWGHGGRPRKYRDDVRQRLRPVASGRLPAAPHVGLSTNSHGKLECRAARYTRC